MKKIKSLRQSLTIPIISAIICAQILDESQTVKSLMRELFGEHYQAVSIVSVAAVLRFLRDYLKHGLGFQISTGSLLNLLRKLSRRS